MFVQSVIFDNIAQSAPISGTDREGVTRADNMGRCALTREAQLAHYTSNNQDDEVSQE